ncbi:MAG: NAD(P)/FAD-dependent oxidoreductase [Burkholderiales bacterium]|nr:NAD(P)/FAD-dependent oxidoreductase [Burkholderiales bacterium]
MHRLRGVHPRVPGQRDRARGRRAGRAAAHDRAECRAGEELAEHHQAQGRAAGRRRLERQDRQARRTDQVAAVTAPALAAPIETDAVVVGAGPVGLFQVFELGLQGIHAHVIDALPFPGGQCIELYPDKPIYDIPATRVCTGRELVARLLDQIEPFGAVFHLDQQVDRVQPQPDGRFLIDSSVGTRWLAKTIVIAGGVGAFQPRRLKLDGLAAFEGSQLRYRVPEAAGLAGQRVLIIGDADAALECAIGLASAGPRQAASVTLMHRRDEFKAAAATIEQLQQLRAAGRVQFVAAQATAIEQAGGRLTALQVLGAEGTARTLPLDTLLVLTGLSPKLGPIADWGLALERKQLVVDTATLQTSTPGIYAVGDVNTYPGKRKLILCGFHEATLAAFAAAERVFPGRPVHLEYTTTSPRLHRALGVAHRPEQ